MTGTALPLPANTPMPHRSRSPPTHRDRRERERTDERSVRYRNEHRPRSRYEDNPRNRGDFDAPRLDGDRERNRMDFRRDERRRDYNSGDYGQQARERERQRDRDRYDRERERERRSASPRRTQSRSDSPTANDDNKAKPNFAPSGLLAAETNTVKAASGESTVLKYNEPPEARRPILGWRLYVFKGEEQADLLHINRQSAYLIGRDRLVADIPIDHQSCSKQHAVIQYRFVREKNELGDTRGVIKPYIIDLQSTNGTHVNGVTIPSSRFYELKQSDVIKFGTSAREYVLLHDEAV